MMFEHIVMQCHVLLLQQGCLRTVTTQVTSTIHYNISTTVPHISSAANIHTVPEDARTAAIAGITMYMEVISARIHLLVTEIHLTLGIHLTGIHLTEIHLTKGMMFETAALSVNQITTKTQCTSKVGVTQTQNLSTTTAGQTADHSLS